MSRVLILDDEVAWRALLTAMVESLEHAHKEFEYAEEAIRFAQQSSEVRVLIVDECLKGQILQGIDVVRAVGEIRPDIRFLFVTRVPENVAHSVARQMRRVDGAASATGQGSPAEHGLSEALQRYQAEQRRFEQLPGVCGMINKNEIEDDREASTRRLGSLISAALDDVASVARENRRLFVGISIKPELFSSINRLVSITTRGRDWLLVRELLETRKFRLEELVRDHEHEKRGAGNRLAPIGSPVGPRASSHSTATVAPAVFRQLPAGKGMLRLPSLKPKHVPFRILYLLAKKAACGIIPTITDEEYCSLTSRKRKRSASSSRDSACTEAPEEYAAADSPERDLVSTYAELVGGVSVGDAALDALGRPELACAARDSRGSIRKMGTTGRLRRQKPELIKLLKGDEFLASHERPVSVFPYSRALGSHQLVFPVDLIVFRGPLRDLLL